MLPTAHPDLFVQALKRAAPEYQIKLSEDSLERLADYYSLLNKWNARLHLVAPCPVEKFATRHILESLLLIHHFTDNATVVDIGSGAGLPIIPCLVTRPDVNATLIESSQKKAVFLREALKETLTDGQGKVVCQRFESIPAPDTSFVTCRALDSFEQLLPDLIKWAKRPVTMLLFGGEALRMKLNSLGVNQTAELIPNSERRFLLALILD